MKVGIRLGVCNNSPAEEGIPENGWCPSQPPCYRMAEHCGGLQMDRATVCKGTQGLAVKHCCEVVWSRPWSRSWLQ